VRVLIVSQYFLPEPLANAETIGAIARGLADRGHEVDVITPAKGESPLKNVRVHRALGYFAPDRASKLKRAAEYLAFSIGAVVAALRVPRPDVILVPSPPPTLGLVGMVIALLKRAPFVYNVQDLYPEVAIATGAVRAGPFLKALGAVMRLVYRRAGGVVVIDPFFVDSIRRAEPRARVFPVRNGIDLTPFEGAQRSDALLSALGVPSGAHVVMYAGNVGRSQALDAVIRATGDVGCQLVIHGGGATFDQVVRDVEGQGLKHVHFSTFRPREELGTLFASADLHVVPLKSGIATSSVPSKMLSIFAAGRPAVVVAESDSPTAAVLTEAGGGWLVPPDDEPALVRAIGHALEATEERNRKGSTARQWVLREGSAERTAAEYESVLTDVSRAP